MNSKEKQLTILLLTEKLQRLTGKKIMLEATPIESAPPAATNTTVKAPEATSTTETPATSAIVRAVVDGMNHYTNQFAKITTLPQLIAVVDAVLALMPASKTQISGLKTHINKL